MTEEAAAPVGSPFQLLLLPPELLLVIFNFVGGEPEPFCAYSYKRLKPLLMPIHINRQLRSLIWDHRPYWRLLARNLGTIRLSNASHETMLNLCNVRTGSTLDGVIFRCLDSDGILCYSTANRLLDIIKAQPSLKLLVVPNYQCFELCGGNGCFDPPADVLDILKSTSSSVPQVIDTPNGSDGEHQTIIETTTEVQAQDSQSRRAADQAIDVEHLLDGLTIDEVQSPTSLPRTKNGPSKESLSTEANSAESSINEPHESDTDGSSEDDDGASNDGPWSDEDYSDEQPITDSIFGLISQAPDLETLSLHILEWPHSTVMQALVEPLAARPIRLQLSVENWVSALTDAEVAVCKNLTSRAEILYLCKDDYDDPNEDYDPDWTPSATVYTVILQSSSLTLRHLEIDLFKSQFDAAAFGNGTFDVLETLSLRLRHDEQDEEDEFEVQWYQRVEAATTRCQMPSLREMRIPAGLLRVLHAPNITMAATSLEIMDEKILVIRSLSSWNSLETLVLYMDPYTRVDAFLEDEVDVDWKPPEKAVEYILKHLVPIEKENHLPCPALTSLGIYDQEPDWWTDPVDDETGILTVECMPKQWDWRTCKPEPHTQFSRSLGWSMTKIVLRRWNLSLKDFNFKPIKEIRTIGFRIERAARKRLRQTHIPFTFSYLAVPTKDRRRRNSDLGARSDDDDWIREVEERRAADARAESNKRKRKIKVEVDRS